jgi:hypothetical protein
VEDRVADRLVRVQALRMVAEGQHATEEELDEDKEQEERSKS